MVDSRKLRLYKKFVRFGFMSLEEVPEFYRQKIKSDSK